MAPRLDPLDLYDVRSLLTDEERMVQDTVARFVDEARAADHRRLLRPGALPAANWCRRSPTLGLLGVVAADGLRLRRHERRSATA